MRRFFVTHQVDQNISVTGWSTKRQQGTDQMDALVRFNAALKPGWRAASIEGVVEVQE